MMITKYYNWSKEEWKTSAFYQKGHRLTVEKLLKVTEKSLSEADLYAITN